MATDAMADYEAVAHAINEYDSECGGDNLSHSDECMNAWDYSMNVYLDYDQSEEWWNDYADGRDWTDDDLHTWGNDDSDPYGTDFADAVLFKGHGAYLVDANYQWSRYKLGDESDHCYVYTDNRSGGNKNIKFGSSSSAYNEADVVFAHACSSLEYDVWDEGGYDHMNDGASDGSDTYGLKMYAGFHGLSHSGGGAELYNRMKNYVRYAEDDGIGDDWVDDFTRSTRDYEDCATVLIWGVSENVRGQFYAYGGFKDFRSVGDYDGETYYGEDGCDPNGSPPL